MKKSLKVNFIMNAVLSMSSMIFPLITFPYTSRILLPVGTGKVTFATSVVSYFAMFAGLGIPTYGIRACAKVRDDKERLTRTAQELLIINLVMTVLVYAVFVLSLVLVPRMWREKGLFIVISTTILFGTLGIEWLYKALEEYTYITVRSIIFKIVALVAMFLLVHKQSDYVVYGGISIFAASASNLLNFFNAHRYISMKPCGGYNFKQHFKPIGVFFAMTCSITAYTNLDNVMLGFMKTDEDVGYYNAAVKVKGILVSVITSLGTVLLPRASYFLEHDMKEEFYHVSKKALNFVVVAAIPLMVYFTAFAKESILILSGDEFAKAVSPMMIIMPTIFFIGLTNIMGMQMLVPTGKENQVLYSVILGAIVDLIANIILIPSMASSGAAIGTLLAEIAVFIYQYIALRSVVWPMFKKIKIWAVIVATSVALVASYFVKLTGLGIFVKLCISAVIYFGIYGILLLVFREPLVRDIFGQVTGRIFRNKKHKM